jgi:hypothetical protein
LVASPHGRRFERWKETRSGSRSPRNAGAERFY